MISSLFWPWKGRRAEKTLTLKTHMCKVYLDIKCFYLLIVENFKVWDFFILISFCSFLAFSSLFSSSSSSRLWLILFLLLWRLCLFLSTPSTPASLSMNFLIPTIKHYTIQAYFWVQYCIELLENHILYLVGIRGDWMPEFCSIHLIQIKCGLSSDSAEAVFRSSSCKSFLNAIITMLRRL